LNNSAHLLLPEKIFLDLPLNIDIKNLDFTKAITLQILNKTTPSWLYWYGRLSEYANENGYARPPQRTVGLGTWVNDQRMNMRANILSKERKALLEKLPGWTWNPRSEIWEVGLAKAKEFYKQNGHIRVSAKYRDASDYKLGQWTTLQRAAKRQGQLDEAEIIELESIPGWVWHGLDDKWLSGLESTRLYFDEFGDYEVPSEGFTYFGTNNLRGWLTAQRTSYRHGKLSAERTELIENLPFWEWEPRDTDWDRAFNELHQIALETGAPIVPDSYESKSVNDLQRWATKQRMYYKTGKMKQERISRLESLTGWHWNPHGASFDYGVNQLRKFVSKHQFSELTNSYVDEDGFRLGLWISNFKRRMETRKNPSTSTQIAVLREIEPLIFETPSRDGFLLGVEAFKTYVQRVGHASIPRSHTEDGVLLHLWVVNRRMDYKKNRLTPSQIETLENLPQWTWSKFDSAWNQGFQMLLEFVNQNGHAEVPVLYLHNDYKLGSWVNKQRTQFASKSLSNERVNRLNSVNGWTWVSQRVRSANYTRTKVVPNTDLTQ
jgi:hypothetical protein